MNKGPGTGGNGGGREAGETPQFLVRDHQRQTQYVAYSYVTRQCSCCVVTLYSPHNFSSTDSSDFVL